MLRPGKGFGKEFYWGLSFHGLMVDVISSPDGHFLASGISSRMNIRMLTLFHVLDLFHH